MEKIVFGVSPWYGIYFYCAVRQFKNALTPAYKGHVGGHNSHVENIAFKR
jgi:hypothetical protein